MHLLCGLDVGFIVDWKPCQTWNRLYVCGMCGFNVARKPNMEDGDSTQEGIGIWH